MKKFSILLVIALAAVLAVALVACDKEPQPVAYKVTVIYDGGSCTVSVEEGKVLSEDSLTLPEKTKIKTLWVNQEKTLPYDTTAAVHGDITLYADLTADMARQEGFTQVSVIDDMYGKRRMMKATKK